MKKLTIKDFTPIIAWSEIKRQMGKKEFNKLCDWMKGQTCSYDGIYPHDLERYLLGLPILD